MAAGLESLEIVSSGETSAGAPNIERIESSAAEGDLESLLEELEGLSGEALLAGFEDDPS